MNIGIDANQARTKFWGGLENYSFSLINALIKLDSGHNFVIFEGSRTVKKLEMQSNSKVVRISLSRLWTQIGLALATYLNRLDILFIPVHAIPLLKKPGLKTVITVHDLYSLRHPEDYSRLRGFYLNWFLKNNIRRATKIIAVSKFTKEEIRDLTGVDAKRISVIYESNDPSIYKIKSRSEIEGTLSKYNLQKPFVLFVSSLNKRKNVGRLIDAYSQIDHTKFPHELVLVGKDASQIGTLKKQVEDLSLESRVKFLGFVPDEDVANLMNACEVVLYPSIYEGFGQIILEAMACGAPVITSNLSSMPEVAGESAIYVDPTNTSDIKEKLEKVLENKGLRDELSKKGLSHVKGFSWEDAAHLTLNVLEGAYGK